MLRPPKKALAAATAAMTALGLGVSAASAEEEVVIREGDFIATLSDTRPKGHVEFLRYGLRVWTESNDSQSKAAEYFAMDKALADITDSTYTWYGTDNQPGSQIVLDADGDSATTDDRGILVGEKVYNGDWWLTNGSSQTLKDGAPETGGGSGSEWFGTLEEWSGEFPDARTLAGGFSLGSGVKGDGVLESLRYGDTTYTFTSQAAEPEPTTVDVTGGSEREVNGRQVTITMRSDERPDGARQGEPLRWRIRVDGDLVLRQSQGFGEEDVWSTRFARNTGRHEVVVVRNGEVVRSFFVRT